MKIIIEFSPEEKEIITKFFEQQVLESSIKTENDFANVLKNTINAYLDKFDTYINYTLVESYLQVLVDSEIYGKFIQNYNEDNIINLLLYSDLEKERIEDLISEALQNDRYLIVEKSKYTS